MNYFVTGGTGFIGRFLIERLAAREGTIYVLVRESSRLSSAPGSISRRSPRS